MLWCREVTVMNCSVCWMRWTSKKSSWWNCAKGKMRRWHVDISIVIHKMVTKPHHSEKFIFLQDFVHFFGSNLRSFFLLYIYQIYLSWIHVDEKVLLKNFGVISIPDSSCYCGWRAYSSSFVLQIFCAPLYLFVCWPQWAPYSRLSLPPQDQHLALSLYDEQA